MIVFYSLGGVGWGRNLGCHGYLDQMFDGEPFPWIPRLLVLGVGGILAGLFATFPFAGFVVELDIGRLQLLIG